MEVHQDPDNAPCDGPNMLSLEQFEDLLYDLVKIDQVRKEIDHERRLQGQRIQGQQ